MFKNLYRPIITCLLVSTLAALTAHALPSSYFASSSRLSSGKWVKIRVTENGMQELSFDALRQMGFEDPSKVAVFGYPSWTLGSYLFDSSLPDDLPPVPSAVYGEKLVFYGESCYHPVPTRYTISSITYNGVSLMRNLDGKDSFYYLTDSCEPTAVELSALEFEDNNNLEVLSEGYGVCAADYRKRSPGSALGGNHLGAYLVGDNCADKEGIQDLYLPSFNPNSDPVILASGVATLTASASHSYLIKIGNSANTKRPVKGYGTAVNHLRYYYADNIDKITRITKTADDIYPISLKFSSTYDGAKELSFDYFALTYPRYTTLGNQAQDIIITGSINKAQGLSLSGVTDNTKVWNISDPLVPFEMQISPINDTQGVIADRDYSWLTATGNGGMQIVAFDPTRTLAVPEVVGVVENQDLHSIDIPEMLIVSSPNNMVHAQHLADLHRLYTGTDVKVVEFGQVCNEFGSGSRHPMAIRRMAKMLYDRDPSRFKALLIMAKSARDNNGVVATENEQQFNSLYIPMLHCEDINMDNAGNYCGQEPTAYGTDAIYGMLNDNFTYTRGTSKDFLLGSAEIQVGRIPAHNPEDAPAYLAKVERYLSTPSAAPLWNSAVVYSDSGDNNMHLEQGEHLRELIAEYSPATTVVTYTNALNNSAAAQTRLLSALSRGVSFWQYMGHSGGSVQILSWNDMMNKDIPIADPPFTVFATCQTQILDAPNVSLQVDMLFNENGGMIGGIGSTRSVYANYNHVASQMGALGYFTRKSGDTFGQVWQSGRQLYSADPSSFESGLGKASQVNTMSFNFIGDPMLPIRTPYGSVKITAIDGKALPSSMEFTSFEPHDFEGAVYNADGSVDTSFNGIVTVQVYDGNFNATIPAYTVNEITTPARVLNFDDYLLQQVKFEVKNGRFSGTFAFALPQREGDYNRFTLFAQTDDLQRTSVGQLENLKIIPDNEFEAENATLPEITDMYAVSPDFQEGDCLPGAFTVHAQVAAGSLGLIGASDHIGGAMSLMLDSSKRYSNVDSYFTIDSEGNGRLAMPVKNISDGQHSLTFSVADLSGETVSRTINFVVANVTDGIVKVENEFCTDQAILDVDHGHDLETSGRVVISDPSGKVVFSQDNASFPFTWNLNDNDGNSVGSGIYSAKVYFKAERRYGFAAPARIIVGKR